MYGEDVGEKDSIRSRQHQYVLADGVQHHLLRHRRNLGQTALAKKALDIILLHIAVPAERLHGAIARLETGIGSAQLRHVGLGSARFAVIEQPGGF